jgi:hypothetical protein
MLKKVNARKMGVQTKEFKDYRTHNLRTPRHHTPARKTVLG